MKFVSKVGHTASSRQMQLIEVAYLELVYGFNHKPGFQSLNPGLCSCQTSADTEPPSSVCVCGGGCLCSHI